MGVIVKYKFDQTIYENLMPTFNSGFTDYTITDEIDTDGFTIRTIDNNSGALPTAMRFGTTDGAIVGKQKCLLDVISLDGNNINDMGNMFRGCQNLKSVSMSNLTSKVTGMNNLFRNCSSLTILNISNLDTSQVTRMGYMFYGCSSLTSLDTSNFNTSQVTDMNNMFYGCSSLTSLDVSNFNTEKVENMQAMFQGCSSLTSLNVSNFNTSKVTNMSNMFNGCSSLTSLDVSNFNTSKVTNMGAMFSNCSSLTSLDVSSFDVSQAKDMTFMFAGSSLTSLDLSSFKINQTVIISYMFRLCNNLTFLDISNFDIDDNVGIEQLFYNASHITDIGMVYCNSSTINKIVNLLTTNTTIWYHDVNPSDLTVKDNITYKKYKSTTLSLNEPIQLRSIGDVHDEINYETGEYIQRIGECIYEDDLTPTYNGQIGGYFDSMKVKGRIGLEVADGMGAISDKLINQSFTNHDFGIYGNLNGNLNIFDKTVKSGEEFVDRYRGTKFQFVLLEPIITKIDTTILDQNNSYKSSQQTYDESTYISVQSDTVVTPTSSVDYEIYSSTGTVTGTSATIENAEAGTPVSGVVYGETLLNCVQDKGNSEVVCLGDHSGTNITIEDSVEGNIKNPIIKGDTYVTITPFEALMNVTPSSVTEDGVIWYGNVTNSYVDISKFKPNTKYIVKFCTGTPSRFNSVYITGIGMPSVAGTNTYTKHNEVFTTYSEIPLTGSNMHITSDTSGIITKDEYSKVKIMFVEYQDGMENWDIPYFEGMKSVTNPSVTVCGKNLAVNKPNTTQEYGGVVFTTDGNKFTMTGKNTGYFGYDFASQEVSPQLQAYDILQSTIDFYNGKILVNEPGVYALSALFKTTNTSELSGSGLHISIKVHYDDNKSVDVSPSIANGTNYENGQKWLSKQFTVEKHINGIWLGLWYTGIDYSKYTVENIQLEKGSTATTYEQYKENTVITTKLLQPEYGELSGITGGDNTSGTDKYTNDGVLKRYSFIYAAKPNTTYTLITGGTANRHTLGEYVDKPGTNVKGTKRGNETTSGTITITTQSDTQYLQAYCYYTGSANTQEKMDEIIAGLDVKLHEHTNDVSLHKIGDIQDELDLETGKLTQRIGEVVLDGSQSVAGATYINIDNAIKDWTGQDTYLLSDKLATSIFSGSDLVTTPTLALHGAMLHIRGFGSKEEIAEFFRNNPTTVHYRLANEYVKTVDLITLDQDSQSTTFHSYDSITHINTSSDYLKPTLEITNPTYDVILKANTEYTIKTNRTNRATLTSDVALDVNLGGSTVSMDSVTNHVKVTTPSKLENNTLTLSGFGNKVKDVMVIEGDYVDRDLEFFEGFISVENPVVETSGKNLFNVYDLPKKYPNYFEMRNGKVYGLRNYYGESTGVYLATNFKPNTQYTISWGAEDIVESNSTWSHQIMWRYTDGTGSSSYTYNSSQNTTDKGKTLQYVCMANPWQVGGYFNNVQIEEGTTATLYEPYQGNTLTTYPQVTLRSIGDIKDEWDVVGETVTRRIGEVVLDGSEDWKFVNGGASHGFYWYQNADILNIGSTETALKNIKIYCNHLQFKGYDKALTVSVGQIQTTTGRGIVVSVPYDNTVLKEKLRQNPITIYVEMDNPITESVRITPPSPQTSTASITIPTQLNYVEDTSDFLIWNPYKEHYVRYNYVEDGVVLDNYTWENLTDLNERQFVEFYNRRTYIDQPYHNYVASHDSKGTSKYVLIEPNQDYTVNVRFSELPTCETVKVNLGGVEVEMNVNEPHVHVTTPNTLANNLCSISGDGLDGKVTDILVIHCLEHEGFADIDYFEGIDGIGEIVEVEGVPKSKIVMEQTNGNLLDFEPVIFNNGNYISMGWNENHRNIPLKANTSYRLKMRKSKDVTSNNGWGDFSCKLYTSELVNTRNVGIDTTTGVAKFATENNEKYLRFYKQQSHNGNTNIHEPLELTYAHFTDNELIRPRYHDKEEILLPIQLHRINTTYDNFYYDEMKGYYRIQQSIGHKYFVGADSENWTLIERGQRVLRFRYNNADIQMKSLGEFMTNRLPNGTATSPYECCAFNGINFIVSIDKERLSSESLTAFKEWLANNNLHLYYQLASPLMIDLPQYPNRIEFNTYKDEIYTFFKNCKPTVFTLSVPLDQTYRFYELEQGEGYGNRVELTDERMTEEDTLYIDTIYGSGISNLIEEPSNVDTMLKPNYEGKATSHSLINGKVSTIGVHGFEPNNVTISNYNTVTKQYELTVQAQQGTNTNTKVLPIPYKFEVYEDGTKDKVYYNSQYKQWMFEGGQTLTVPYNASTGAFTSAIEVFRGLQPRSGLIGEFKVRFASGTTSARLYYSINGTTYGYTTLRGMTDEVDYYIGFFNTGGSKIDMGTKIDANAEYTTLVPINGTIPECLMINQIQSITECTYYQDKTYYYSDVVSPLVLDVYNGETIITELNGAVIDIQNNAHNKQALIYGDTTYTVYWTYVGGEGNIKVTLGGVTQEVVATQGYATITTSNTDLEKGLLIGGFDVTIKDLMLIKGERITDLKYFEGSRAVGTAFTDENGETMYKITLVTGSELINDKFEEIITFEDNKKHNVVVTKLLGAKPDKI